MLMTVFIHNSINKRLIIIFFQSSNCKRRVTIMTEISLSMRRRAILDNMISITFLTIHKKTTDVKHFTFVVLHLLLKKSRQFNYSLGNAFSKEVYLFSSHFFKSLTSFSEKVSFNHLSTNSKLDSLNFIIE